jgi:agmatinase
MDVNPRSQPPYAGVPTFMFLPLNLEVADLKDVDVAIVGAPMDDMVTNRPGTRFGPRAIRGAYDDAGLGSWHMDLGVAPFQDLTVVDHGDAGVIPGDAHANHRAIRSAVEAVAKSQTIPIVLGGDHSISYPNVAGVAEVHDDIAIVHFDTHADTGADNWGLKWAHGTPFRNLVDQGVVRGERLVQIGLRGYWPFPGEWAWMRDVGVRWHRMDEVFDRGIDAVMNDVLQEIEDATNVFLSVDIDVLDPAFAPGTGTPEPGGMSTRELLRAVRKVASAKGFVGMDVVEVSPPYDHAGITAQAAHRVVVEALAGLAINRRGGEVRPEEPS